jgi:hypothetical protein
MVVLMDNNTVVTQSFLAFVLPSELIKEISYGRPVICLLTDAANFPKNAGTTEAFLHYPSASLLGGEPGPTIILEDLDDQDEKPGPTVKS